MKTVADEALGFAERMPEAPCAIEDGRIVSYADLVSEAQALAGALARLGVREGEVISFQLPTLAALLEHCVAAGLAKQKAPERLEIVADLPRTASGKVRKDLLRKEIAAKIAAEGK